MMNYQTFLWISNAEYISEEYVNPFEMTWVNNWMSSRAQNTAILKDQKFSDH